MTIPTTDQVDRLLYPAGQEIHLDDNGPLDNIHEIKNHLINALVRWGSDEATVALEKIYARFPKDDWLSHCIIDARTNEQATKAPILSISKIKELLEEKNNSRRLINSIQDLHHLVSEKLNEYQLHLQGDTPAIGDLWNIENPICPKDEEYLSDHLSRFLKLTMSGVAINREVQIRRKQYDKGTPGSRTDLWIQAINNDETFTLCIEVKCNWNPSAKSAIRNQLIGKYMSGGTAKAGILLLGWYACSKWDTNGNKRSESTTTWADIDSARSDLEKQCEQEKTANQIVSAIVIDCSLK